MDAQWSCYRGGKKMSKSLGNFVSLKEIYTKYHPDVLRLLVLFTHYRSPLDFSFEKMEETKKAYERLKSAIEDIEPLKAIAKEGKPVVDIDFYSLEKSTQEQFYKALSEDFNTSLAMAQVFNAVAELNRAKTESFKIGYITPKELEGYLFLANSLKQTLKDIFGLLEENTLQNTLKTLEPASSFNISTEFLEILIKARNLAKENKDFKVADFIRDELLNHGIKLEDTKAGTIWKKL
jgi:cysteinyl-tRNA synthetase (EC 6.1.1.16)